MAHRPLREGEGNAVRRHSCVEGVPQGVEVGPARSFSNWIPAFARSASNVSPGEPLPLLAAQPGPHGEEVGLPPPFRSRAEEPCRFVIGERSPLASHVPTFAYLLHPGEGIGFGALGLAQPEEAVKAGEVEVERLRGTLSVRGPPPEKLGAVDVRDGPPAAELDRLENLAASVLDVLQAALPRVKVGGVFVDQGAMIGRRGLALRPRREESASLALVFSDELEPPSFGHFLLFDAERFLPLSELAGEGVAESVEAGIKPR